MPSLVFLYINNTIITKSFKFMFSYNLLNFFRLSVSTAIVTTIINFFYKLFVFFEIFFYYIIVLNVNVRRLFIITLNRLYTFQVDLFVFPLLIIFSPLQFIINYQNSSITRHKKQQKFFNSNMYSNKTYLNIAYYFILIFLAVLLSLGFFYITRNTLFRGVIVEFLIFYSLANFVIALIMCALVCYIFKNNKFNTLKISLLLLLFTFFFSNEIFLVCIMYNKLTFIGIYVPLGYCPWKGLRLAFTVVFLSTFVSIGLSFRKILRYFEKEDKQI